MNIRFAAAVVIAAAASTTASAFEAGSPGFAQYPGLTMGASAGAPPPGIYGFTQIFTGQQNLVGPGKPLLNPTGNIGVQSATAAQGFLWVPGWTFLGATYDAVVVQPFIMNSLGSPLNQQASGAHNTFIVPVELSWRLGDSGFFAKAGLGMYVPDGTINGINGLGSLGNPWWTFSPELFLSYIKNGWNVTANLFYEINTKNTITDYTSGDVFHAEFSGTKRIGQWTIGPAAYYMGQVTNDTSSGFYNGLINANRYNVWAVGGLVGYDFGPVSVNVWAFDQIAANVSGGQFAGPFADSAAIPKGLSVYLSLNYRLWAPDAPDGSAPQRPFIHK
ncbi:MAG: transporter [Bradyrhizobium sp.]